MRNRFAGSGEGRSRHHRRQKAISVSFGLRNSRAADSEFRLCLVRYLNHSGGLGSYYPENWLVSGTNSYPGIKLGDSRRKIGSHRGTTGNLAERWMEPPALASLALGPLALAPA